MSIFDMLPPKDASIKSGAARTEPAVDRSQDVFSFESDPIHLVYDETTKIEESEFRYRIWLGVHRTTVCLVNTVTGVAPSWRSSELATFIYNKHVTKAKNGIEAPLIYIEIGKPRSHPVRRQTDDPVRRQTDDTAHLVLSSVDFKRVTHFDAQRSTDNADGGVPPVRFYNPKNRVISSSVLEILVGGPIEGV